MDLYMKAKAWREAQPYAEAAAQTWAHWAMLCAAECAEGLQEWDRADRWRRRTAERYPNARLEYLVWCGRTGHGSLARATALAEEYLQELGDHASDEDLTQMGSGYLLAGRPAKALATFERSLRVRAEIGAGGFFVALLADDLNKPGRRDQVLQQLVDANKPRSALARLFLDTLTHGKPLDLKAVDEALKKLKPGLDKHYCYFVARLLEKKGRPQEALTYYRRCADAPRAHPLFRALAAAALREHGNGPLKPGPKARGSDQEGASAARVKLAAT